MMPNFSLKTAGALLVGGLAAAVNSAGAQAVAAAHPLYNSADVQFVQGMMAHHAQAIVMSALVPSRTNRNDIVTAARRIGASQRDEIALMQRWLEHRGERVPSVDTSPPGSNMKSMAGMPMPSGDSAVASHMLMPGMLTAKQLKQLGDAQGARFDRLFLQFMIAHHQGALTMVKHLFGTSGATQDPEIFQLASDIDSDQRAEIARMHAMQKLKHLTKKHPRS